MPESPIDIAPVKNNYFISPFFPAKVSDGKTDSLNMEISDSSAIVVNITTSDNLNLNMQGRIDKNFVASDMLDIKLIENLTSFSRKIVGNIVVLVDNKSFVDKNFSTFDNLDVSLDSSAIVNIISSDNLNLSVQDVHTSKDFSTFDNLGLFLDDKLFFGLNVRNKLGGQWRDIAYGKIKINGKYRHIVFVSSKINGTYKIPVKKDMNYFMLPFSLVKIKGGY